MRGVTGCLRESVGLSFCVHHSYPEGMAEIVRKHRPYEKPTERRKRKMNAARRKSRRAQPA
jgi:hypothetical protein